LKIGFRDDRSVEVLEGLAASEGVIVPGKTALSDGMPIQVDAR